MRPSLRWSVLVVVVASTWGFAQPFTGAWAGSGGQARLEQLGARVRGAVTVEAFGGRVQGTVGDDARVSGTYVASGGEGRFVASVEGELLSLRFDDGAPVVLKRVEGARRRLVALAPTARGKATGPSSLQKVPKAAVFRAEDDGWALHAPKGWTRRVEGSTLVLRSPAEPVAIVASFRAEATAEEFQRVAKEGFVNDGRFLRPRGSPEPLPVKGGTAHAVDLETTAPDGSALYARAASVVGDQGGVLLIGLSPPSRYGPLRERVDQSAQSITFSPPMLPPGRLRGSLCSDVGGSIAASTRYTFDGRGHLSHATEVSSPRRPLPWVEDVGTYRVLGDEVSIRFGDELVTCRITERHDDGQVTGLRCGERVFGAARCP